MQILFAGPLSFYYESRDSLYSRRAARDQSAIAGIFARSWSLHDDRQALSRFIMQYAVEVCFTSRSSSSTASFMFALGRVLRLDRADSSLD